MTITPVVFVGQSFVEALIGPIGKPVMTHEFARAGLTLEVIGDYAGTGGASMLKENAPASFPDRYFWDLDAQMPGPLLTRIIAVINAAPHKPSRIFLGQGEGDSVVPAPDGQRWIDAASQVIWKIKQACNPTSPNNVGTIMLMIGRRLASAPVPGVQIIREAQVQLDLQSSVVYGCDIFDVRLFGDDVRYTPADVGDSHGDARFDAILAWRAAQRLLMSFGIANTRMSPEVLAVTGIERVTDDTFSITIKSSTPITHPTVPSHMAVRLANGDVMEDLFFEWTGNKLAICSPFNSLIGAKFLFPYGNLNTINRAGLIYDEDGTPLRTTLLAIP